MANWLTIILLVAFPASLMLYAVIRRLARKGENKISSSKVLLLILIFGASLMPYTVFVLITGLHDFVYFFLVWALFYITRSLPPSRISIVIPIVCSIMLAIPVSTFVYIGEGRVTFFNGLPNLLQGYGMITRVAYFCMLLVSAHYLLKSMEFSAQRVDEIK